MKVNNRIPKLSALAVAITSALVPMVTHAEDDEAAASKTPVSSVEIGLSNTSNTSAKFGEYNGLNKAGVDFVGNFNLRGGDAYGNMGSRSRWSLFGNDLGLTSRSLGAMYSEQGRWNLGLKYDELRHFLSNTYQTPYVGAIGGNTWVLPGGFGTSADTTALTAAQRAAFHNLDIYSSRKNTSFNAGFNLNPQWEVKVDYNRLDQDGAKLMGFGSAVSLPAPSATGQMISILPSPTSYKTDTVNLALHWAGEKAHVSTSYFGSFFHNDFDRIKFQTYAGANVMETMSTPPGNTFHQLNLAGGYTLAAKTKLAGNFSYGVNTQNQAFAADAFMFVPGSTAIGNTLASANAKVNTTHADLKLTHQSIKDLALSAGLKYDQRDNRTPSNIYNFVAIDGGNIANYPNTPLSFRKSQFEAAGDYRLAKNQHVRVAYTHEDISRWCNQYAVNAGYPAGTNCVVAKGSIEDKLDATYRLSAFDSVNFRFGYGYSKRREDADPFARAAFIGTNGVINGVSAAGQNAGDFIGFHPFIDASRTQQILKGNANWEVNERVSLGLGGRYTGDNYDTPLGMQKGTTWSVNLDATYRYSETGSLSSYVTQQHRDRAMTDQQRTSASAAAATATAIAVPAGATWSDKLTDDDITVGLGVKHTGLLNGKLDLAGDASYSLAKSGYTTQFNYATTTTGGLICSDPSIFSCGSTPDVKTTISQLKFTGTYQIDKKAKVALRYIYQRMSGADYYYNGYQLGFTPTQVMPTNQQLGNYSVNVISLSYIYSF